MVCAAVREWISVSLICTEHFQYLAYDAFVHELNHGDAGEALCTAVSLTGPQGSLELSNDLDKGVNETAASSEGSLAASLIIWTILCLWRMGYWILRWLNNKIDPSF